MTTINSETRACHGNGTVGITKKARNSIKVDMLVVPEKPLSYDLQLWHDAIKLLGGIHITCMRTM